MNNSLEGISHNSIWPDEPVVEEPPQPPSFESQMDSAQNTLQKKIEELIRAWENRAEKQDEEGDKE
jgi:hypothetical protein